MDTPPRFPTPPPSVLALLAVVLVLGAFALDIGANRKQELGNGARQVEHNGRMLAEHVARSFDSIEVLLDELGTLISERTPWWEWSAQEGHEMLKGRLSRSLPQIRHILLFDADGKQRFASFGIDPTPIDVKDRPYFQALLNGTARARYGPYVGRNSNRPTYAVARRLSFPDGRFAGALMIGVEPAYFEKLCGATLPFDQLEAALVNAEGRIIGICRSTPGAGEDYRQVLAKGEFAGMEIDPRATRLESDNYLLSTEPVPGYPDLRIVSAIGKEQLLGRWRSHALQTLMLAATALLGLGVAALFIRRQFLQLDALAGELRRHRDTLESRVREATVELEGRRADAVRLAEAKSRFLAAASHDLRQPLHALQLFVADLARNIRAPEHQLLLSRIELSSSAITRQLESLLELSRLDMADIVPQRQALAVDDLFRQLESTYGAVAMAAGVRLLFHPRPVRIDSDPTLLARLLGNLIDNAIKFTPGGTVLVCARWHPSHVRHVRLEVRDNGPGIPPEHQQAVFEEFFQVGNKARDPSAGLGLGLAIVSRIGHLLGTPLTLHSRLGRGTVFALAVPVAVAQSDAADERLPAMPLLVLLGAEAERDALAKRAAGWGYRICTAAGPVEADRLLASGNAIPIAAVADSCRVDPALQTLLWKYPGIVISPPGCSLPELGPYHMHEPVKPARLRALLRSMHSPSHKEFP